MLPPTTEEECLELLQSMENHYAQSFRNFADDAKYYDGNFSELIKLPDGFDLTVPTTLRAVVDEAIDNVMPSDLIVNYPPRGMSKKAEEDADAVRRYLKALWRHWRRNGSDIDVLRDCGKNLFMSGMGSIKIVPDWTLWPVLPDKDIKELREADEANGTKTLSSRVKQIRELRDQHAPLTIRSLPPACVMIDPTVGARKLWQVERYETSIAEISSMYAEFEEDFRLFTGSQARHKVHEIWTATHADWKGNIQTGKHFIFIDRIKVFQDDNPYPDLPFVTKYSGFGRESYDGRPEFKSVGFYTPQVKSLGRAEARRYSQFDAIMAQLAFPIGILPMDVDADSFDTSPGAMNFVPDSVMQNADKIWLRAPIPDGEYLSSLRVIGSQIERGTTQAPLRGAGVPGTDSASQLGMYTTQAKLRLESVKMSLEDMVAMLFSKALRYIDQTLQDDTSVFVAEEKATKYTVGPKNIQGHYHVTVTFMPNEESVKERKLALASDAIVKGGLSPYDALVYAGFDNPTELIARRMAYDVMQEPLVKRAMARDMLKDWGIDADQLELEEQMEMGNAQKLLSDFMNMLQTGSMRGVGDPMSPDGSPPGGGQDQMAALAQAGQGPMAQPAGPPVQDPALMNGPQMQQPVMR